MYRISITQEIFKENIDQLLNIVGANDCSIVPIDLCYFSAATMEPLRIIFLRDRAAVARLLLLTCEISMEQRDYAFLTQQKIDGLVKKARRLSWLYRERCRYWEPEYGVSGGARIAFNKLPEITAFWDSPRIEEGLSQ